MDIPVALCFDPSGDLIHLSWQMWGHRVSGPLEGPVVWTVSAIETNLSHDGLSPLSSE